MASSRTTTPIQWGGSGSVTLSSATRVYSDAFVLDVETYAWALQVKADVTGTASSGDTVDVSLHRSCDGGTTWDTDEHADGVMRLNGYGSDSPGEDPAVGSIDGLPAAAGRYKLSVTAPNAATHNIVVTASRSEHKVQ